MASRIIQPKQKPYTNKTVFLYIYFIVWYLYDFVTDVEVKSRTFQSVEGQSHSITGQLKCIVRRMIVSESYNETVKR